MKGRQRLERRYGSWARPFRLQLTPEAALDFEDELASRGACQYPSCNLFEWSNGVQYCREHYLLVHGLDRLPERWYGVFGGGE
jgi:hypothetical protein